MKAAQRELALRELARRHYADYLAYAQDRSWIRTRMSTFLADEVQNFIEKDTGHAYDILVVNCPPQHGKSMTITESLPSWYLGKHPDNNVIIASYDSDFAERFCKKNKEKIRNVGRRLFGIEIGSIDRAAEFELSNGKGRLIARGIMSGITGNPANLVIIDDPVKNQLEADSPTYRQRLWGEWQASIKSRLAANAKIIIIMTPWREDVFDMEVIRSERNVRHIKLPVEARENDALGRKLGEPLCPELGKDAKWLEEFRASYITDPQGGQRAWTAMYLCSPRIEDGNLIKREWWRFYSLAPLPKGGCQPGRADWGIVRMDGAGRHMVPLSSGRDTAGRPLDAAWNGNRIDDDENGRGKPLPYGAEDDDENPTTTGVVPLPLGKGGEIFGTELISVDAAFRGGENNDFVSIQVWGKRNNDYYLEYCMNRHMDFPETVEAIRTVTKLYPKARQILIEEAANGAAIIATLQNELFIIPVTPQGGKVARVNAVSAAIESGHVFLPDPKENPWVSDFIDQWTAFPNAKHDDMVDAASQALSRLFVCSGEVCTEIKEEQHPDYFGMLFNPYRET